MAGAKMLGDGQVAVVSLPGMVRHGSKDTMIVATAMAARADHLVTGDRRHLLPLGS